jgi:phage-related baseplate assembly protein
MWTAIDLSKLPPPNAVETLNYEAILAALKADLARRAPDLVPVLDLESEPLVKLLEVCAYRELVLRAAINDKARAVMLTRAVGSDLDNLAANLGVVRLAGESDEDLRIRAALGPEGWSTAGPKGAYLYHALSAHPDVSDAEISSPGPALVNVKVLARVGDADASLLSAVAAALNDSAVRPIADQVTVSAATRIFYTVEATLIVGSGADVGLVLSAARAEVAALCQERRKVGRKVSRAALIGALMVAGVEDVVLTNPAVDVGGVVGTAPEVGIIAVTLP